MAPRCSQHSIPDCSSNPGVGRQFAVDPVDALSITLTEKAEKLPAILLKVPTDLEQCNTFRRPGKTYKC